MIGEGDRRVYRLQYYNANNEIKYISSRRYESCHIKIVAKDDRVKYFSKSQDEWINGTVYATRGKYDVLERMLHGVIMVLHQKKLVKVALNSQNSITYRFKTKIAFNKKISTSETAKGNKYLQLVQKFDTKQHVRKLQVGEYVWYRKNAQYTWIRCMIVPMPLVPLFDKN
jgi:hypothetical protein